MQYQYVTVSDADFPSLVLWQGICIIGVGFMVIGYAALDRTQICARRRPALRAVYILYKTRVTVGTQGMLTLQCSTKTQLLGAYSQLSGRLQISYCNLAFLGIDFSDTRTVPYYYKGRKESGPT